MADTQPAMAYPTSTQYERWKDHAKEMDMTISEFMQAMIEAGMKKFDATVEPDETNRELRQQRNELKDELDRTRDKVRELEDRLHHGERTTIIQFVEENPGATHGEIGQHVTDTIPGRIKDHFEALEGEAIRREDGRFYPIEEEGEDG